MSLRISVESLVADYTETRAEERANILSHAAGLIFALAVAWPLVEMALPLGAVAGWTIASFAAAQVFTYISSTLYHATPDGRLRRIFLACDHIAIYGLIAGTWTPLVLLTMDHWVQAAVLAAIWTMAGIGTALRLFRYADVTGPILLLYLACGWGGVILLPHVWIAASPLLAIAVAAGGIFYTVGVVFYLWRSLPFNHLYWHLFSLAGSIAHVAGIWLLLHLLAI
jgi:hemolysin III